MADLTVKWPDGWQQEPWIVHGARWPEPHEHDDLDRMVPVVPL